MKGGNDASTMVGRMVREINSNVVRNGGREAATIEGRVGLEGRSDFLHLLRINQFPLNKLRHLFTRKKAR